MGKRVNELAKEIDKKPSEIIRKLQQMGVECNVNTVLTDEQVQKIYDLYRIKNVNAPKVVRVSEDGEVQQVKTVVISAPGKRTDSAKKDVKDAKPKVTVVKTTKGGETKTTIKRTKQEEAPKEDKKAAVIPKTVKAVATEPVKPKEEQVQKIETPAKKVEAKVVEKEVKKTVEPVKVDSTQKQKTQQPERATHQTKTASGYNKDKDKDRDRSKDKDTDRKTTYDKRKDDGRKQAYQPKKDAPAFSKDKAKKTTDSKFTSDERVEITAPRAERTRADRTEYQKKDQEKTLQKDIKKEKTPSKTTYTKDTKYTKGNLLSPKGAIDASDLTEDELFSTFYVDKSIRRKKKRRENIKPKIEVLTFVKLPEILTVKEFAETIKKSGAEVLTKLMAMGADIMSINDNIDFDTASVIADEFGISTEMQVATTEEDILFFDDETEDNPEDLEDKAPVVVIMGHVDHGKTSLLDFIKKSKVAMSEAGSITQHVGAYRVNVQDRYITFLDTPGHEAFTAMRKRGADVTDIAIITVAANDGIMPQTVEAINHAKAAGVTIIIAINKIDLPTANPDRVMQQLMEHNLVPTAYGGDIECIPVSAKTGEGIDILLDTVLLTADILELKANPHKQAKGIVLESRVEKAGTVTTLLIQRGTIKKADYIIAGTSVGNIKALYNDVGKIIESAGPSEPVEILGLDSPPEAGEFFYAVDDEKTAKSLAERRKHERQVVKTTHKLTTLDDLFNQIQAGKVKDLNLIVKADVQGSVEAITESFHKLTSDEVKVHVVHGAVGTITETDVSLAEVTNSIIIGFNVRPLSNVTEAAKSASVDIRLYSVIYDAIEDVKNAMAGMLDPKYKEVVYGHAEVRNIFKITGAGTVAGCMVISGKIIRNSNVRLVRDGITIYDGVLSSLKRFKDDVREVAQGYECGMSIEKYNDIKVDDIIECYKNEVIKV